jgi:hypothetical protein
LNIAVKKLPETCDKVAWLDADILFHNDHWIQETGRLLKEYPVVQLFETAWFLSPDYQDYTSCRIIESKSDIPTRDGAAFMSHCGKSAGQGHPGLAWAARRSLLQAIGFYDRAIVGGADSLQMLAMFGPSGCDGLDRLLSKFTSEHHVNDMFAWATRFDSEVRRKVSYVKGPVLHLWHGNQKHRQYESRFAILKETDFNPSVDNGAATSRNCISE